MNLIFFYGATFLNLFSFPMPHGILLRQNYFEIKYPEQFGLRKFYKNVLKLKECTIKEKYAELAITFA